MNIFHFENEYSNNENDHHNGDDKKMIMDSNVHDALLFRLHYSLPQSVLSETHHGSKPNSPPHWVNSM